MIARVIVDTGSSWTDRVFDYSCFDDVSLGSKVLVPFGKKNFVGYVIELTNQTDIETEKLKSVIKVLEREVLSKEMLELSDFMVQKYNLKIVDTLKLFLPSGVKNTNVKPVFESFYKLANNYEINVEKVSNRAKNQLLAIDYIKEQKEVQCSVLNQKFGISSVKKLEELGIITKFAIKKERRPKLTKKENKKVELTNLQKEAVSKILTVNNKTILLHGVTGSGKTEVYMNVIEKMIENKKNAIMLVPEISLTPQVMQNFVSRFGDSVAILHSGLSLGEKLDEWNRIKDGKAKIVVGARSAVFAPLKNIGLIIIDEEHDTSYYSESNPRYFTHEVAKFRADYNNCNLVLGSATPTIEDYFKAKEGQFELVEMPVRVNRKEMPKISIVDMQSEIRNGNTSMFSNILLSKIKEKIDKNEQIILFLNRRGYNSFVMCRDCGYCAKCEDCDVSLVYHKNDNELKCHYCGKRYHTISECPNCHSNYIRYGAIGTQKVVEELQKYFKNVKIFRMDNDSTTTKDSHEQILSEFANQKPSILVGTQMIAKGHDFPLVTLVGIIDADVSLHFSDYRANERTFDLITQVSGRAGRSEKQGEVILQTYCPKHYVYRYASDYDFNKFYDREINLRKVTKFPPYTIVSRVLITSEKEDKAIETAKNIFESIKELKSSNSEDFVYLNAMKSPVKRIEKRYRYQILMRIKPQNFDNIIKRIFEIVNSNKNKDTLIFVEQNPQNLS